VGARRRRRAAVAEAESNGVPARRDSLASLSAEEVVA